MGDLKFIKKNILLGNGRDLDNPVCFQRFILLLLVEIFGSLNKNYLWACFTPKYLFILFFYLTFEYQVDFLVRLSCLLLVGDY